MDMLEKYAAEHATAEVAELRKGVYKTLIDASFRDSVIPEIQARTAKIQTELDEKLDEQKKLLDGDADNTIAHTKTHRLAKKANERRVTFLRNAIAADEQMVERIKNHTEKLRSEAKADIMRIEFIEKHFPTDVLKDFAAYEEDAKVDAKDKETDTETEDEDEDAPEEGADK